jgi:hypothetical protein
MGTMGLPVLISVLQEDRDDLELLQGALEVLCISCSSGEGAHSPPGSARKVPAAGQEVSSSTGAHANNQQTLSQQLRRTLSIAPLTSQRHIGDSWTEDSHYFSS